MPIITKDMVDDSAGIDDQFRRTGTRVYLVIATTDMLAAVVRADLGIYPFNEHPDDPAMLVVGVSVSLYHPNQGRYNDRLNGTSSYNGSPVYFWTATVTYGPWNPLEHAETGDPTEQPLDYDFVSVNTPEIVSEDVDGNPCVNAAGDYYDPPIERDFPRWTLTITRNELTPALATLGELANRTNESAWNGFPPKTVKIAPIQLTKRKFSQFLGELYAPLAYVFEVNYDTWTKVVPNMGFRELDENNNLRNIRLADGMPPSSPVPLDKDGHKVLAPGYKDSGEGVAPDDPTGTGDDSNGTGTGTGTATTVVLNAYEIYRPMDFAILDQGFSGSQMLGAVFS